MLNQIFEPMISRVFQIVAASLYGMARATGLTYNEVNILVYYFLIPLSWIVMLDQIFQVHYLKISFVLVCIGFYLGCRDFRKYSDWLFAKSVDFLNLFNRVGSNYIASSVWICVALPLLIYIALAYMLVFG
jgi:hypothetical protein